jgi:Uma2 family endonuclease
VRLDDFDIGYEVRAEGQPFDGKAKEKKWPDEELDFESLRECYTARIGEFAMASTSQVPVELYLHSSYEPDAEYVDGEIELRPMGEYDHASWQQAIQQWFLEHAKEWNIRVRPELRVRVSPSRYRVPDVVVFDRNNPIEQILTHPPIAVFEVLSPEDTMARLMIKLADYDQMGIRTIDVVDPNGGSIYHYVNGGLERIPFLVQELAGSSAHVDWRRVREFLD